MKISTLLTERGEDKTPDVYVDVDGRKELPADSIKYLKKEINKLGKDLTKEWKSPLELVNNAFGNLDVPIPNAFQSKRWNQYTELIGDAISALQNSKGILNN